MRFQTLNDWLSWLEGHHPRGIDLGLERIAQVWRAMGAPRLAATVITVAGTNGKGSCVAALAHLAGGAGLRHGSYTSPHLLDFNERIRLQGTPVSDAALLEAFAAVDTARAAISLTYFEFTTLAAFWLFTQQPLDVVILEVGLGGRLDAVNLIDADVAIITPIDLDHQDYLGSDLNGIAAEKAGIARAHRPVLIAGLDQPEGLRQALMQRQADILTAGEQWRWGEDEQGWFWQWQDQPARRLPRAPKLVAPSVCAALACAQWLQWPCDDALFLSLAQCSVAGRQQRLELNGIDIWLDVAHNPAGAAYLAQSLQRQPAQGKSIVLFAAFADKDLEGVITPLGREFQAWFLMPLKSERSADPAQIAAKVSAAGCHLISVSKSIAQAYRRALSILQPGDRMVVTGSFLTVAGVMAQLRKDGVDLGA